MRLFLSAVIGLALLTAVADADENEDGLLRVMTYNIHHGSGLDGKLDLSRIARVIADAKPDLVALQEVDFKTRRSGQIDQASKLAKLCDMKSVFGKAIDYQGGQYGNAVLSAKTIIGFENHQLPRADGKENRSALTVTIQLQSQQQIVFASTHFDHHGTQAREDASRVVHRLAAQSDALFVLAGDLNAEPKAPALLPLASSLRQVNEKPMPTVPAIKPVKQIDYIFIDKRAKWQVESVEVIDDGGASDHRPMLAVLRIRD